MLKCVYCGRENADEMPVCTGCGTSLVPAAQTAAGGLQPRRSASVGGIVECALGVAGLLAGHGPSVVHLLKGVFDLDSEEDADSPHKLLECAAHLEGVDICAAVALYEQIVLRYPGSVSAKEAARNLQTLKAAHPELPSGD